MIYTNKLFLAAQGVTEAEGWHPQDLANQGAVGSASYRNHNPGNLRKSEYEVGNTGEFSIFDNDISGFAALVRQLEMIATGKDTLYGDNLTIEEAFEKYTGLVKGSKELTDYVDIVCKYTGSKPTDLVSTLA